MDILKEVEPIAPTNIVWFLDPNPISNAQFLDDTDLKNTIYYIALLVSTTLRSKVPDFDFKAGGYTVYQADLEKASNDDVRWLISTSSVWRWTRDFFLAACKEHSYRFGTSHPSEVVGDIFDNIEEIQESTKTNFSPPPLGKLPAKYYVDGNFRSKEKFKESKSKGHWAISALNSFRQYYKVRYSELEDVCWTKRSTPEFLMSPHLRATTRNGGVTLGTTFRAPPMYTTTARF